MLTEGVGAKLDAMQGASPKVDWVALRKTANDQSNGLNVSACVIPVDFPGS